MTEPAVVRLKPGSGKLCQVEANEYLEAAAVAMERDGSVVSTIETQLGIAVVGYQSQFRLRWFATKLHAFTVVVAVPIATPEVLGAVTRESVDYAKRTRGRLRGLQTGVAALPVLVSTQVQPDVCTAVESRPPRAFAAITLPAIVDLAAGRMHRYDGRVIWGAVYTSWLCKRLDALPPLQRTH